LKSRSDKYLRTLLIHGARAALGRESEKMQERRIRELRCFHAIPLLSQPGKLGGKLQPQTIQFSGGRALVLIFFIVDLGKYAGRGALRLLKRPARLIRFEWLQTKRSPEA
jgi:hypothetical protein